MFAIESSHPFMQFYIMISTNQTPWHLFFTILFNAHLSRLFRISCPSNVWWHSYLENIEDFIPIFTPVCLLLTRSIQEKVRMMLSCIFYIGIRSRWIRRYFVSSVCRKSICLCKCWTQRKCISFFLCSFRIRRPSGNLSI